MKEKAMASLRTVSENFPEETTKIDINDSWKLKRPNN
jgi:hypothetical protein